jgi:hypothetical protein
MHQLAFDTRKLEPQSPRQLMESALTWITVNPAAWSLIVHTAHRDADRYGRVDVKLAISIVRRSPLCTRPDKAGVRLPNAFSSAFSRILAAWYPELAPYIPTASSKLDGVVIPPRAER